MHRKPPLSPNEGEKGQGEDWEANRGVENTEQGEKEELRLIPLDGIFASESPRDNVPTFGAESTASFVFSFIIHII